MSRIALAGKAYVERANIAGAQETINLYAESNQNDPQAPTPFTYYPTPGSTAITQGIVDKTRCTYRTSIGGSFVAIGPNVYNLTVGYALVLIGNVPNNQSQVYIADNGQVAVLVDGTQGWVIDLSTNQFALITDPSFYGADFVVYQDTFFIFNRPATDQFYISLSQPSFGMLSGTALGTGTISAAGAGYVNAVYSSVPLTGGSGTGALADITVTGNAVTAVDVADGGKNYLVGDVLSADPVNIGGAGAGFTFTMATVQLAFDPLDIAAKSGSADPIVGILSIHDELWLIGALTTEVWIGTGAADFFYQRVQGAYIEHGCIARYSCANTDVIGIWLMQDKQGKNIVVQGSGYEIDEISTPYLVDRFNNYDTTDDAIGFFFQIGTHAFYCLVFPTANETWLYSLKVKQWFKWASLSPDDGSLNRNRANCSMYFNKQNIVGDFENGKLYTLSLEVNTDDTVAILRRKTFLHMVNDMNRVSYSTFEADMQVGEQDPTILTEPQISLSWSDDRGKTFGFPVEQGLGRGGEFLTILQWNRCGMARDRIFMLEWSGDVKTALNGGFATVIPSRS
jgi:hypothetical protein